jgi:outer membrane receptor protein involved in Fe transport
VFNSTTILNVRYGYNRFDRNSDFEKPEALGFDLTKLGFPAEYNSMISESIRRFPRLDFTGGVVSVAYGGDLRPVTSHTVAATLNKSLGAHALKSGVEIRQYGERSTALGNNQSGQYAFQNNYTRQSSASGADYDGLQAYATFLLGMPSTMSITRSPTYDEYSRTYGFFVQDDWRVNSKLTVTVGLRYEVESALVEKDNKERVEVSTTPM